MFLLCLVLGLKKENSRQTVLREEYTNSIVYVISVLWFVYRWIYNMQIKNFISKPYGVRVWKPSYFGAGCTKIWRISPVLPGLVVVVSKCVVLEMAAEEDFGITSVCKSHLPLLLLSRALNRTQDSNFLVSCCTCSALMLDVNSQYHHDS